MTLEECAADVLGQPTPAGLSRLLEGAVEEATQQARM